MLFRSAEERTGCWDEMAGESAWVETGSEGLFEVSKLTETDGVCVFIQLSGRLGGTTADSVLLWLPVVMDAV